MWFYYILVLDSFAKLECDITYFTFLEYSFIFFTNLKIRRTRVRLIMFYKIIHHVVAIHPLDTLLLPTTTITRYNLVVITYQHIRTDKDSYSFYPRTIIQWNLLPIHVHEAITVDAFNLKGHCIEFGVV